MVSTKGMRCVTARTKTDAADDDDPNTQGLTAASAGVWVPRGVQPDGGSTTGFRGYLEFDEGETCDVTIWLLDQSANDPATAVWVAAGTLTGVARREVIVDDDLGDAVIYPQIENLSGGEPVEFRVEERA